MGIVFQKKEKERVLRKCQGFILKADIVSWRESISNYCNYEIARGLPQSYADCQEDIEREDTEKTYFVEYFLDESDTFLEIKAREVFS